MSNASSRLFAVVPAAGQSRRMGQAKLLLPFRGRTVIAQVLEVLRHPAIARTVVVVRPDDAALRAEVSACRGTPLIPDAPPPEMRNSVEFALRWLERECKPDAADGWLLSPADHPLLDREVLDRLIQRWQEGNAPILIPTCNGRRGHPALFRWELTREVFELPADVGLNELVRRHEKEVVELETGRPSILADLDTPEDYARLLENPPESWTPPAR
jgi:molybdenum cofactor cytidylyltransferase